MLAYRILHLVNFCITIFAALFQSHVSALPAGCLHNPAYKDLSRIIHRSRVYGPVDRRKELTPDVEKELKFNRNELNQINKAVGAIFCPAEAGMRQTVGTAFLMERTDEIMTAGHVTIGEDGRSRDLAKCKFTNYGSPRETFEIDAKSSRNALPAWAGGIGGGRYDRARLKLKRPVKGVKPFVPDPDAPSLKTGTPLLMFASQHRDFDSTGNRPVVSFCKAGGFADLGEGVAQLKTDCDSGRGASGSPVLIRRDGSLFLEGMNISESNRYRDANSEFDEASNFQSALSVVGNGLK